MDHWRSSHGSSSKISFQQSEDEEATYTLGKSRTSQMISFKHTPETKSHHVSDLFYVFQNRTKLNPE